MDRAEFEPFLQLVRDQLFDDETIERYIERCSIEQLKEVYFELVKHNKNYEIYGY